MMKKARFTRKGVQTPVDSSEIARLSLLEKQELLYFIARNSRCREALETWKRKDLLELLCLEMGKQRKYTGVPKSKMIDRLLELVCLKGAKEDMNEDAFQASLFLRQNPVRRQRKVGCPSRLPVVSQISVGADEKSLGIPQLCRNTACKAQLSSEVPFCKRCSCYICHRFDDNKDPSLWIICSSDSLDGGNECGISCHIDCALDQELAGVVHSGDNIVLDGSYRCESCGRIGDLIGCWKKQLLIAKSARRVDILCYRLSLSCRLLNGSHRYEELHNIIDRAARKLESEVGSITEGSAKLVRGIVSRLSCWADIQNLIGYALVKVEEDLLRKSQSKSSEQTIQEEHQEPLCAIQFDDISSESITVMVKERGHSSDQGLTGFKLWHRTASDLGYLKKPSCLIHGNEGSALFPNLAAATEYVFRVIPFSGGNVGSVEARCITKGVDNIQRADGLQMLPASKEEGVSVGAGANNDSAYLSDDLTTSFKVRELETVLHPAGIQDGQPSGVMDGILQSTDRFPMLDEHDGPALDVLPSPEADASSIDEEGCKPQRVRGDTLNGGEGCCKAKKRGGALGRLSHSEGLDVWPGKGRAVAEMGPTHAPAVRAMTGKGSFGLTKEKPQMQCSKQALFIKAEEDEASDPSNSDTARGEDIDVISPVASGCLQANAVSRLSGMVRADDLELNGHGEGWAVQIRAGGTSMEMEPRTHLIEKSAGGGSDRPGNCYSLMNRCTAAGSAASICTAKSYEFCVKIIRWLECEGFLKEDFRMKFLTWFSLRATDHERRVVSVFIDTLQDNPLSLAGQLVDTFGEIVSMKRQQAMPNGFCNRLWH